MLTDTDNDQLDFEKIQWSRIPTHDLRFAVLLYRALKEVREWIPVYNAR